MPLFKHTTSAMHAQTYARLYAHVEYSLLCQGNYILFMCATSPSSGQSE